MNTNSAERLVAAVRASKVLGGERADRARALATAGAQLAIRFDSATTFGARVFICRPFCVLGGVACGQVSRRWRSQRAAWSRGGETTAGIGLGSGSDDLRRPRPVSDGKFPGAAGDGLAACSVVRTATDRASAAAQLFCQQEKAPLAFGRIPQYVESWEDSGPIC